MRALLIVIGILFLAVFLLNAYAAWKIHVGKNMLTKRQQQILPPLMLVAAAAGVIVAMMTLWPLAAIDLPIVGATLYMGWKVHAGNNVLTHREQHIIPPLMAVISLIGIVCVAWLILS